MSIFIVLFVAVLCLVSGAAVAGLSVWKKEEEKLRAAEAVRLHQMHESREAMKEKGKEIARLKDALRARDETLYALQARVNELEAPSRGSGV